MSLRLNKFCCCCTTRTGALVIGTLGWIFTLLQIFGAADPRQQNRDEKIMRTIYDQRENDNVSYQSIYLKVGYGLVALLVCILLIVGVYKKDKRYILPWLVLKGLEATLVAILAVVVFIIACINAHGVLFGIFFIVTLAAVLHWYFWLCVWSHYKELGEEPVVIAPAYSTVNSAPPQYNEKTFNMA